MTCQYEQSCIPCANSQVQQGGQEYMLLQSTGEVIGLQNVSRESRAALSLACMPNIDGFLPGQPH